MHAGRTTQNTNKNFNKCSGMNIHFTRLLSLLGYCISSIRLCRKLFQRSSDNQFFKKNRYDSINSSCCPRGMPAFLSGPHHINHGLTQNYKQSSNQVPFLSLALVSLQQLRVTTLSATSYCNLYEN